MHSLESRLVVAALCVLSSACGVQDPVRPPPSTSPGAGEPQAPVPEPPDPSQPDDGTAVALTNPGSATVIKLTPGLRPAWSPDGSRLAFISSRTGEWELFAVNRDGTGLQQLTSQPVDPSLLAWSPDGSRIAYQVFGSGGGDVRVIRSDGSSPATTLIAASSIRPVGWSLNWSPDGQQLLFVGEAAASESDVSQIYVVNADGSNLRALSPPNAHDAYAIWSPDGRKIAVVRSEYTAPCGFVRCSSLILMDADGSGAVPLTSGASEVVRTPVWSPDGKRIAFGRATRYGDWGIPIDPVLEVIATDGSGRTQLTDSWGGEAPSWSRDGSHLLVGEYAIDSGPRLASLPASGGAPDLVIPNASQGTWSPDGEWIAFVTDR